MYRLGSTPGSVRQLRARPSGSLGGFTACSGPRALQIRSCTLTMDDDEDDDEDEDEDDDDDDLGRFTPKP